MNTPTHIIECEGPESWGFKTHEPAMQFAYSEQAAITLIRSKLGLSASTPLKHKHIWKVRKYGSNAGDYVFTAAG